MNDVWCVWTEYGEYEQFSRDLRGIFASDEMAEVHAAQLRVNKSYDVVEVVQESVLTTLPRNVPYVEYAAHIRPDGSEDKGLGYDRGEQFRTFSNELNPVDQSRIEPWSPEGGDLYIEVTGSDEAAVAAEYARRLAEARQRLATELSRTGVAGKSEV